MKHLVIIGAGGYGRALYYFAKEALGYGKEFDVKGFLDPDAHQLDGLEDYPPIIGVEDTYVIEKDDVFICAFGDINLKKKCCQKILDKGGEFINLIHPLASLPPHAKIGKGNIFAARSGVGVECAIGDFNLIQDGAIIGHDVKIGNWCRVDCYVVLIAGVTLEDEVCVHTSAVINHNVTIGKGAMVGAQSFVIRNVKSGTTVFGNPAKKLIV